MKLEDEITKMEENTKMVKEDEPLLYDLMDLCSVYILYIAKAFSFFYT